MGNTKGDLIRLYTLCYTRASHLVYTDVAEMSHILIHICTCINSFMCYTAGGGLHFAAKIDPAGCNVRTSTDAHEAKKIFLRSI